MIIKNMNLLKPEVKDESTNEVKTEDKDLKEVKDDSDKNKKKPVTIIHKTITNNNEAESVTNLQIGRAHV